MQQIEVILYTLTRSENKSFGSHRGGHGSGVYGIAVLSFFSSGISVILILMCGLAVSSSPSVCGFLSLWLRYSVKEDPSRYCGTVHWALLSNV